MEKKKKITKEDLAKENAILEDSLKNRKDFDELTRQNLSQFLNAPFKKRGQYDYSDADRTTYSWPEIYFHLGKLVSERNDFRFREQTTEQLTELAGEVRELKEITPTEF